jgi:hypothetical protein
LVLGKDPISIKESAKSLLFNRPIIIAASSAALGIGGKFILDGPVNLRSRKSYCPLLISPSRTPFRKHQPFASISAPTRPGAPQISPISKRICPKIQKFKKFKSKQLI